MASSTDLDPPPSVVDQPPNTVGSDRRARRASDQGNHLLTMGASVGAIGLLGALAGAVCPLCVVATPALLTFGLVQKLRGLWLRARARKTVTLNVPLSPRPTRAG